MISSFPEICPSPVQAQAGGYENLTVTQNLLVAQGFDLSSRNSPRVLRSRRGQIGIITNLGGGSPSFIKTGNTQYRIHKCNNRRCKTCPTLSTSSEIIANVTHRKYNLINHTNENINCHSQNIIYLITCMSCNIQYVGETAYPLHKRINQHRTSKCGCENLINHSQTICTDHKYTYQVLEKLPGSGYKNDQLDAEMTTLRKSREDEWIKKLRTIYPYGLNEKALGKQSKIKSDTGAAVIGKIFPPLPRTGIRPSIGRRNKKERNPVISSDEFFRELHDLLNNNIKDALCRIRILLNNSKRKLLKDIAYRVLVGDITYCDPKRQQYYDFIGDYIDSIFWKEPKIEKKKQHSQNPCIIHFVNKGFNKMKIARIFKMEDVTNLLPEKMRCEKFLPFPTFKLDAPIRNKILNYKETVTSLQIEVDDEVAFVTNPCNCECDSSPFRDPHHNHIITGDLRFIENVKLRKLLSKGPNYREPKTINFNKCRKSLQETLDNSITIFATKHNLEVSSLTNWKNKILELVDIEILKLKEKIVPFQVKPLLKDPDVIQYLKSIHSKYVITPIDKASKNIAIICKKFYINSLMTELGIPGNNSTTYHLSSECTKDIVDANNRMCKKFLYKDLVQSEQCLPIVYWIPKMHYTPPRRRFIIASSTCSTKPLSKLVSMAFKHIFNQIRNFHLKSVFYKNYNMFWVIENSSPITHKLNEINRVKGAKDISTYDFSTLYTKLPHADLINVLNEIVEFVFDGKNFRSEKKKRFLTITDYSCYWSNKKQRNSFTKENIKELVSHLITKCFFQFGNLTFLQKIGIPMGIDPAPFWANLYLYYYEKRYVTEMINTDHIKAKKFRYASRFIDDEGNLNDNGEFGRSYQAIYPKELVLKCEHHGSHATFLDMDIHIEDGMFVYKLFDKRDSFPFEIVRMPNLKSNIPDHVFYGSFMAEVLRIGRATLRYEDFLPRARQIYTRMNNQGGSSLKLKHELSKVLQKHPDTFINFTKTNQEIISDISNL